MSMILFGNYHFLAITVHPKALRKAGLHGIHGINLSIIDKKFLAKVKRAR
tara:strand:- start:1643 stop:1792 length:150 start_codon:yes stop_codon:yes gene_type:complete